MALDEAIERYTSNAEYERTHGDLQGCLEFRQLAEWLRDYKRLKEQELCDDAISRQAVNILVDELARAISDERCCISRGRSTATIMQDILDLPSVKPQERTGHWILQPSNKEHGERDFIWWKCSECGQVIYSETEKDRKEFHAFCGRCGARMESKQNG